MDNADDSIDVASLDHEIDHDLGWTTAEKPKPRARRSPAYWQAIIRGFSAASGPGQVLRRLLGAISAVVFFPVFSPFRLRKTYDIDGNMTVSQRSRVWRIFDGILMRVLLTPVILGLFLMIMVWMTTHPQRVLASRSPQGEDMIYREVDLRTSDGQRLSAWYIPAISVEDVQFSGGRVASQKWPGVVVCHGLGSTQDDYLPLARSLHEAGFAVLMVDLRGQGASDGAAITFGIRERFDVLAGVKYLRELPAIDTTRVCVVGQGIGATAALHAAALDSAIVAVVADGVWPSFDKRVKGIFDRPSAPTRWMAPLYRMTFEMMMRERIAELDLGALTRTLSRQPVLFLAYPMEDGPAVEDVLALAEQTPAPHQVIVASEGEQVGSGAINARITTFLTQATHWVSPRQQVQQEIQRLRADQVK